MTTIPLGVPYKDSFSVYNAKIVLDAVHQRFPAWADQAKPYINILTLKAWNQRGYRVKKGQKAIRVFTKVPVTKKDEKTGEEKVVGSRPARACVFALPQVEKRNLSRPNTHSNEHGTGSADASPNSSGVTTPSSGTSTSGISGTTSASLTP